MEWQHGNRLEEKKRCVAEKIRFLQKMQRIETFGVMNVSVKTTQRVIKKRRKNKAKFPRNGIELNGAGVESKRAV